MYGVVSLVCAMIVCCCKLCGVYGNVDCAENLHILRIYTI